MYFKNGGIRMNVSINLINLVNLLGLCCYIKPKGKDAKGNLWKSKGETQQQLMQYTTERLAIAMDFLS